MLIRVRRTRAHPAAEWTSANPYLREFELGIETEAPHKAKLNISDVPVRWNDLDYWKPGGDPPPGGSADWGSIGGTLSDQTDLQAELDGKVDGTAGVKVYRALLTQTSTDAPTATVLENSLGGTLAWTRDSMGIYLATLAGAFPDANKVFLPNPVARYDDAYKGQVAWYRSDADNITTQVKDDIGSTVDGWFGRTLYFEILVYP